MELVYDRVIIEYKNPASPSDRIGAQLDSSGTRRLVDQIKSRFSDLEAELGHPPELLFGVGTDGLRIVFVRYRNEQWQEEPPSPLTHASAERLLWALFNLGHGGRPFSSAFLARDFGSQSGPAIEMVRALYGVLSDTSDAKATMLYEEWRALFGVTCGYDALQSGTSLQELADLYEIEGADGHVDLSKLLFCAHTYFALFMKIMAAEIVSFYHRLPSFSQKAQRAATSQKLNAELDDLEAGGIFQHLGIRNFLEGDLFSWYLHAWDSTTEAAVRTVLRQLDEYNLGTLSDDPAESRDLLKDLYLAIIPREVRHSLGEYYTPDWLAELVIEEFWIFRGSPDKSSRSSLWLWHILSTCYQSRAKTVL